MSRYLHLRSLSNATPVQLRVGPREGYLRWCCSAQLSTVMRGLWIADGRSLGRGRTSSPRTTDERLLQLCGQRVEEHGALLAHSDFDGCDLLQSEVRRSRSSWRTLPHS